MKNSREVLIKYTYWALENIETYDIVPWKVDEYMKENLRKKDTRSDDGWFFIVGFIAGVLATALILYFIT